MDKKDYYENIVREVGEDYVIITKKILLEKGKTTTKGEFPKLKKDKDCAYPERLCCNYGEFFKRCPFMKYERRGVGCWYCSFGRKDDIKPTNSTNETK